MKTLEQEVLKKIAERFIGDYVLSDIWLPMNLSFIEIKCLYSLKRCSHKTTYDFNTMYRRFLYESDNKAK